MDNLKRSSDRGFTMIEMMIVLIILTILFAVAIPSYQSYVRRSTAAQAQQAIQQITTELEKHRSRNFNYRGYSAPANLLVVPAGATGSAVKYNLTVVDGAAGTPALTAASAGGQSWIIRAVSTDNKNYSFLATSHGMRCKTGTAANISYSSSLSASCGSTANGSEPW